MNLTEIKSGEIDGLVEKLSHRIDGLVDGVIQVSKAMATMVIMPYAVPSFVRHAEEKNWFETPYANLFAGAAACFCFQMVGYYNSSIKGHAEVFFIPLVTNFASGIYESYRMRKSKEKAE